MTNRIVRFIEEKEASRYGSSSYVFKCLSPSEQMCIRVSDEGKINNKVSGMYLTSISFHADRLTDPTEFPSWIISIAYNEELFRAIENLAIGKYFYLKAKHFT